MLNRAKGSKPDLEALLRAELKLANSQVAVVCNEGTMCVRRWVRACACMRVRVCVRVPLHILRENERKEERARENEREYVLERRTHARARESA